MHNPRSNYDPDDGGFVLPDQGAIRRQIEAAAQQGVTRPHSGPQPKYVKHLPPDGCQSWSVAPVNSVSSTFIWLCPLIAPGRLLGFPYVSHFGRTKYARHGHRLACGGDDCRICEMYQELRYHKDPDIKAKVSQLKQRTEVLYNVVHVVRDADHIVKDAQGRDMRKAALLSASKELNRTLLGILEVEGPNLCHPQHGRALVYKKTKTGPQETEVCYSIMQYTQKPLPKMFWDLCRPDGMWDLEAFYKPSSETDQLRFIAGIGLQAPQARGGAPEHMASHGAHHEAHGAPQSAPPADDDWGAEMSTHNVQSAPRHAPPPQRERPSNDWVTETRPPKPAPGGWGDETASLEDDYGVGGQSDNPYAAPPADFSEETPPPYQPPSSRHNAPQNVPQSAPQTQQRPKMAIGYVPHPGVASADYDRPPSPPPPPKYGTPTQAKPAASGPPKTSAQYAPVAQGARSAAPQEQSSLHVPSQPSTPRLYVPLPEHVRLPGDRELCFGNFDPAAQLCEDCPPPIKVQCQPQTPGYVRPEAGEQDIAMQQLIMTMRDGG